jgi:protein-S-isoprenylcysteine O-methyltransferase Ste14
MRPVDVVFTMMRRALALTPCILIAIIGYLRIAREGKHLGQERVYESKWAYEGVFPGLDSLRMVVLLSVRRRGTTQMDPGLDLYCSFTIAQPILAGLDAARFHGAPMPSWSVYPGVGLFLVSAAWITWVLVRNPHAESSVRIQTERDHSVVSSGPYRFVRHPMYVGLILLHVSIALVLGSMWTLILAGLFTILFFWRTALEDQTLRRELSGYEEYTQVTRYRLMPGIW